MIKCDVFIHSTSEHISQLCTGFVLLESQKKIRLSFNLGPYTRYGKQPFKDTHPYSLQGMFVVINDSITIFYDTTDGENVLTEALLVADLYFKRSYRKDAIFDIYKDKIFSLGLNYEVHTGNFDKLELGRFFLNPRIYKSPKHMIKSVLRNLHLNFQPTTKTMYAPPAPSQEPKVLFMARTWDPENYPAGLSAENVENWKQICNEINQTRASVIGLLRKNLGDRFYGGFSPGNHSVKHFGPYLLQDASASAKADYIRILRDYPICIASTGLYNSIGWKLAEYVAFSKAIVSEKLYYEVPGDFSRDKNYLEFETADQCVEQTYVLLEDNEKRAQMMENNHQYYRDYLAPDKLVWRTLEKSGILNTAQ